MTSGPIYMRNVQFLEQYYNSIFHVLTIQPSNAPLDQDKRDFYLTSQIFPFSTLPSFILPHLPIVRSYDRRSKDYLSQLCSIILKFNLELRTELWNLQIYYEMLKTFQRKAIGEEQNKFHFLQGSSFISCYKGCPSICA